MLLSATFILEVRPVVVALLHRARYRIFLYVSELGRLLVTGPLSSRLRSALRGLAGAGRRSRAAIDALVVIIALSPTAVYCARGFSALASIVRARIFFVKDRLVRIKNRPFGSHGRDPCDAIRQAVPQSLATRKWLQQSRGVSQEIQTSENRQSQKNLKTRRTAARRWPSVRWCQRRRSLISQGCGQSFFDAARCPHGTAERQWHYLRRSGEETQLLAEEDVEES